MSTVLFDTQIALDALKKSGVPEEQARDHVRVLADALDQGVATKGDVLRLETKITSLEASVSASDAKMAALQWRMTALIIGANGVLGLLLRFGG